LILHDHFYFTIVLIDKESDIYMNNLKNINFKQDKKWELVN